MSTHDDRYRLFLEEICGSIKDLALAAKARRTETSGSDSGVYNAGEVVAYGSVIDLIKQVAPAFEIPLWEIGLNDVDVDRDLLSGSPNDFEKS